VPTVLVVAVRTVLVVADTLGAFVSLVA